jgi:hypothetical protein
MPSGTISSRRSELVLTEKGPRLIVSIAYTSRNKSAENRIHVLLLLLKKYEKIRELLTDPILQQDPKDGKWKPITHSRNKARWLISKFLKVAEMVNNNEATIEDVESILTGNLFDPEEYRQVLAGDEKFLRKVELLMQSVARYNNRFVLNQR